MPRAPKRCGHLGCTQIVTGKPYCPEHAPKWRGSQRVVPTDWKRRKAQVLEAHGRVCHLCGHPDAEEVDHILNVAAGGSHDLTNLAPIHGRRCPTCGRRCHVEKTSREAAAGRGARVGEQHDPP